ncbi:MAG: hypothetical protein WCO26_19670 [Deltaproteobacteria bacterium]
MKNEIATPFGLAMTMCGVKIFDALVLASVPSGSAEILFPYKRRILQ